LLPVLPRRRDRRPQRGAAVGPVGVREGHRGAGEPMGLPARRHPRAGAPVARRRRRRDPAAARRIPRAQHPQRRAAPLRRRGPPDALEPHRRGPRGGDRPGAGHRLRDRVMKVRWVYRPDAAAVTPSNTLRDAAARMHTSGQSALPVVDGSKVIGIVTERDIVEAVARGVRTSAAWVYDYTHDGCTSIALDDECETVALKMLAIGCRHLPVVDGGRLIGMVSMRDVVLKPARLARPARRPAGRCEEDGYLSSRPPSTTISSPVM